MVNDLALLLSKINNISYSINKTYNIEYKCMYQLKRRKSWIGQRCESHDDFLNELDQETQHFLFQRQTKDMFVNENKVSPRKEKTNKAWKQNKGYNIIDFVWETMGKETVCGLIFIVYIDGKKKSRFQEKSLIGKECRISIWSLKGQKRKESNNPLKSKRMPKKKKHK